VICERSDNGLGTEVFPRLLLAIACFLPGATLGVPARRSPSYAPSSSAPSSPSSATSSSIGRLIVTPTCSAQPARAELSCPTIARRNPA
jgi:hypothetical protein